jgi:hypothetical protein
MAGMHLRDSPNNNDPHQKTEAREVCQYLRTRQEVCLRVFRSDTIVRSKDLAPAVNFINILRTNVIFLCTSN